MSEKRNVNKKIVVDTHELSSTLGKFSEANAGSLVSRRVESSLRNFSNDEITHTMRD